MVPQTEDTFYTGKLRPATVLEVDSDSDDDDISVWDVTLLDGLDDEPDDV